MMESDEIAAVQGSPITQTKSSVFSNGKFLITQCFYEAVDPSKSVNLAVTTRDPDSASQASPGAYWKERFAASGQVTQEPDQGRSGDVEERRAPPKKVEGMGDDAYWIGRDALYVLKGDLFVRLSIGGADSMETKIEKAKTLAGRVLSRLPARPQR